MLRRGARHEEEPRVVEQDLHVLQLVVHGSRVEPVEREAVRRVSVREPRPELAQQVDLRCQAPAFRRAAFPSGLKFFVRPASAHMSGEVQPYAEAARPLAHVLRLRAPCCTAPGCTH
eukprot:scaffold41598_cov32-Phaeocystis_antarctica.AAC.2